MKPVRTRFAPSPTGFLHVGGIRTALFAWLVARQLNGQFILRIEDTDQAREVQGSADHIQECLQWLGLEWDEGPYFQSQRLDLYREQAQKLVDAGRAYPDPFTPEQLQTFREDAVTKKKPFLFRDYAQAARDNPAPWDGKSTLRFKANLEPTFTHWIDSVMGEIRFQPANLDDFILMKSDGFPTYNFAHIVDDIAMDITHVIRGQEFLSSIPNYLNLYEALQVEPPHMATVPPIMNEQGNKKLSKRDGAKDILAYRTEGYLPEAMRNFLASLGWNDGTEDELFTTEQLVKQFRLERVQRSGARFDERRLLWMNGTYLRGLTLDAIYTLCQDYWPAEAADYADSYKKQVLGLVQERIKYLAELPELSLFFFKDLPVNPELISGHKQLKKLEPSEVTSLLGQARAILADSDFTAEDLQSRLNDLLEQTQQKPAILFSLIRIATTQSPASPGLAESLAVLGKDRSLSRLDEQLRALA